MDDITMPSGKYKGFKIWKIPSGYLKWISENWSDETIASVAGEEFAHREHYNVHFWEDKYER